MPLDPSIRTRFADVLTEKVCEAVRGMPDVTSEDVRDVELIVAAQLVTGRRSMSTHDARAELNDFGEPVL